jgi:heme A synthase
MDVMPIERNQSTQDLTADNDRRRDIGDVLAVGFGTTVAIWAVGYVGQMPLTNVPPVAFVGLMLLCLLVGGWVAGRYTRRGVRGGALVGLVSAALNLLIVGSLLQNRDAETVPTAWLWLPGTIGASVALAAVGASMARMNIPPWKKRSVQDMVPVYENINWAAALAWITCAAALLLITAGGLVTGLRAGMAVPNWPGSFDFNMFLFPLAIMTGGVFYEHAHRLLGSLLALCALTLAIYVAFSVKPGKRLVALIWAVGTLVAVQGLLGGFRVTENSAALAVLHGFIAHLVLAGLVLVAVMLTRNGSGERSDSQHSMKRLAAAGTAAHQLSGPTCRRPLNGSIQTEQCIHIGISNADCPHPNPLRAPTEGWSGEGTALYHLDLLALIFIVLVFAQTLLGVLVRQMNVLLLPHVAIAAIAAAIAMAAGTRAWGRFRKGSMEHRCGMALIIVVILQIALGIVAVVFRTPPVDQSPSAEMLLLAGGLPPVPPLQAILTTLHQTNAALMLGLGVILANCHAIK